MTAFLQCFERALERQEARRVGDRNANEIEEHGPDVGAALGNRRHAVSGSTEEEGSEDLVQRDVFGKLRPAEVVPPEVRTRA
jgi:hypothetical protein